MSFHKLLHRRDDILQHRLAQAWIGPNEGRRIHELIRPRSLHRNSKGFGAIFAQLDENGLAKKISAKKHSVSDLVLIEVIRKLRSSEGSLGTGSEHEAEPGAVGLAHGVVPGEGVVGCGLWVGRC